MRKYLIVMVVVVCLGISLAPMARAQSLDWQGARKQLKSQQKLERHSLQVQQRNMKASWKGRPVTSAERTQAKHEMQRASRDLKQRQKDAMQVLKDRQKSLNSMRHAYGQ
jgi:hypothetical protein